MKTWFLRRWYKLIRKNPAQMPMVRYWKKITAVEAKVTTDKNGSLIMVMEGEDYPFPSFPRGYLLYGKLSKIKHEIKNQIFNESWYLLEAGKNNAEIAQRVKQEVLPRIYDLAENTKYDRMPYKKMPPSVKEIYRAWTKVAPENWKLRDILCFVLTDDDSYRNRVQWLVTYFNPNRWWFRLCGKSVIELFSEALTTLENGEVIGDMKERQRLLKRILLALLQDPGIKRKFLALCKEIDWDKVKLTKGDKYHFRGKYFKVDYNLFDY